MNNDSLVASLLHWWVPDRMRSRLTWGLWSWQHSQTSHGPWRRTARGAPTMAGQGIMCSWAEARGLWEDLQHFARSRFWGNMTVIFLRFLWGAWKRAVWPSKYLLNWKIADSSEIQYGVGQEPGSPYQCRLTSFVVHSVPPTAIFVGIHIRLTHIWILQFLENRDRKEAPPSLSKREG